MRVDANDVMALLADSRNRWTKLRARGREWRDHELLIEAFKRGATAGGTFVEGHASVGGEPVPDEEPWALWISLPESVRVEFQVGRELVTAVFRGVTWWSVSSSEAMTNEGDERSGHGMGPAYQLTDPAVYARALDVAVLGETSVGGRRAVTVSARPGPWTMDDDASRLSFLSADDAITGFAERHRRESAVDVLGTGADEYELQIDIERGVILRSEARLRNTAFRIIEMTKVEFDARLPEETFTLEPPPGKAFMKPSPPRFWTEDPS